MQANDEIRLSLRAAEAVHDGPPEPTLLNRIRFYWFCVVTVLVMIPMSLVQFITHAFQPTARNFKRNAAVWGRGILGGAGVEVRVSERARLDPNQPYIFVANHQNSLDIMALAAALPYPFGFVAKVELKRVPFLGLAMRNSACVFLDRSDARSSVRSLQQAGAQIRAGMSVLIFPEGSRSLSPRLQPLKKGAFSLAMEAGVPLVPVTILDGYRLLNEKRHALRPGTLHLVVGEPISLEGKHRRDIPEVMAAVEAQIAGELERYRDERASR